MLKQVEIKAVIPKYDKVLVHIKRIPKVSDSGIILGLTNEFSSSRLDIDNYTGEIVALGESEKIEELSPGLKIGDNVLFSQFAGYHVPTGRDVFAKLLTSTDIHCKVQNGMKLKLEEATPVGDRLLLEVLPEEEVTESGIIVGKQDTDPRQLDAEKCKVRGIGPNVKDEYEIGDIVYIPQYVGNTVILDDGMRVKTVNYFDILFIVK